MPKGFLSDLEICFQPRAYPQGFYIVELNLDFYENQRYFFWLF